MPDDVQRSVPRHLRGNGDRAPDYLDQALEFRAAYGSWPSTWVEFCHGIGHLSRAGAAEKLRIADAVAAHKQEKGGWRQWVRDHEYLSGGG